MSHVDRYPGQCVHSWLTVVGPLGSGVNQRCVVEGCIATCRREGGEIVEYELRLPRPPPWRPAAPRPRVAP